MSKAKGFWYVLVMSNKGPVFVTVISAKGDMAYWHAGSLPKAFNKSYAMEVANGLTLNGTTAYAIYSDYEIKHQPYNYEDYEIEWKEIRK